MAWIEIARNHLLAAKRMCKAHPRSAISRAYYAAHVILTDKLLAVGYIPAAPYQTAPHRQQSILIGLHFAAEGAVFVTGLSQAVSRLYKARLDADYSRLASIEPPQAKEAIRDAAEIFALLEVEASS
jgi:uncharacterized protein (UPF0332 family)